MNVNLKARTGPIAGFTMAISNLPAHNFDFKRWLTWGEPQRSYKDKEYPDGYPTEQDCLPEPENEFEVEE
jgi:hypothetical protein